MPPKAKTAPKSAKHLQRAASAVQPITASGALARNFSVWCDAAPYLKTHPADVFTRCLVIAGSTATELKLRQVEPAGFEKDEFTAPISRCWNANDDAVDPLTLRDIGLLNHQNTAAVLDFLKKRFLQNQIYTTADPLLVAVNPFKDLGNCTDAIIERYRDVSNVHTLSPHSFAVSRQALDNLHGFQKSQTIIVTGESGAGKTEATKHCMRFFASTKGGIDMRIQKAVMAANPVLEAFGNAKTLRNNNSSRFGRFMRLSVGAKGGIMFGSVQGFLLEKVRVVSQMPEERSYHIFYQMLKGLSSAEKQKYKLGDMKSYKNLNATSGGCYDAPGINDVEEFEDVRRSLVSMQLDSSEVDAIFSIVSGVLMLGNVDFAGRNIDGQDDAAELDDKNLGILKEACHLLSLDDFQKVADCLRTTEKMIGTDAVTIRVQRKDALLLCASLGKAMYDNLFKWIIRRLNDTIEPKDGFTHFMGMLDIFGFEVFADNSLEQLLINITNEFLQKNFVDIVFEKESKLYRDEGVSTTELVFTDNKDVIEALIGKRESVFACLEDSCVAKGGTDSSLHSSMARALANNKIYSVPSGGERGLKFVVAHTIAEIEYSATNFISKNMDILKADLTEVAQSSSNRVVREMFDGIVVERGKLAKGQLIASQFLKQLDEMMGIIRATEPHFIRCVKPNETKKPHDWAADKVLSQLFSLSILEALQLKKLGFSWRRSWVDFLKQFRFLNLALADEIEKTTDGNQQREISKRMIAHISRHFKDPKTQFIEGKHWQLGKTMVFLKPEISQQILLFQRQAMEDWVPSVVMIEALYAKRLMAHRLNKQMSGCVRLQSQVRKRLGRNGLKVSTSSQALYSH